MTIAIIVFYCLYSFVMVYFTYGWNKKELTPTLTVPITTTVSVIIALRNEEHSIHQLLQQLKHQNYQKELYEVILINDHSTDNTWQLLQEHTISNWSVYQLPPHLTGKKAAITFGVQQAKGSLLLFTDADCTIPSKWISHFAEYYQLNHSYLIAGPVSLNGKGWWSYLQQVEFMSLQVIGGGSIRQKRGIMCNGANLGVDREQYLRHNNKLLHQIASGDDMFILLSIKEQHRHKIHFLKHQEVIISTPTKANVRSFISQRKRWAGKVNYYQDVEVIFTAILVFTGNIVPLVWVISGNYLAYSILFLFKSAIDFIVLSSGAKFFKLKKQLWYTPILQILYPVYVLASVINVFGKVKWKGREI